MSCPSCGRPEVEIAMSRDGKSQWWSARALGEEITLCGQAADAIRYCPWCGIELKGFSMPDRPTALLDMPDEHWEPWRGERLEEGWPVRGIGRRLGSVDSQRDGKTFVRWEGDEEFSYGYRPGQFMVFRTGG